MQSGARRGRTIADLVQQAKDDKYQYGWLQFFLRIKPNTKELEEDQRHFALYGVALDKYGNLPNYNIFCSQGQGGAYEPESDF